MGRSRITGLIAALSIAAAACGTAEATTPDTTAATPSTTSMVVTTTVAEVPTTTEPPRGSLPVRNLDDVDGSVVQIIANGTFETPEGELANVPGSGTGFVIEGTGLAVTNNHVVTGAAYLEVFVSGEDEPRNAQIVGVSECSDLAVIDIEGDFASHLTWYDVPPNAGLEVYVAGFPLGDPEYTLYEGIVAKSNSEGESPWASVAHEIEHTADTRPGNSGSPIVTADGKVVGVHYASGSHDQAYGIAVPEALEIIEQLAAGEDVASIGINGEAFIAESGFSGIWVSSVQSGSAAANAGVRPGDIVSRVENLVMATDGTMADYCKVLRSHDADDQLSIEVLRLETGEVLEGVLNGSELEVVGTIDGSDDEQGGDEDDTDSETADTVTVSNDSGSLSMVVPAGWDDVESGAWKIDGEKVGKRLGASPDMDVWHDTWGTPGAQFQASEKLAAEYSPEEFLDTLPGWTNCTHDGRFEYDDGVFAGVYDQWSDCGSTDSLYLEVAATPNDGSYLAFVQIVETTEADHDATMTVLSTFMVEGSV